MSVCRRRYIEKQEFLQRADSRRFEIERQHRERERMRRESGR